MPQPLKDLEHRCGLGSMEPKDWNGRYKCLLASGVIENCKRQLFQWAGLRLPPLLRFQLLWDSEPTPRPLGFQVIWLLWCSKEFSWVTCSRGSETGQDPLRRTSVSEKGKRSPSKHSVTPPGHLPGGPEEQPCPEGFLVHAQGPDVSGHLVPFHTSESVSYQGAYV